MPWIAQIGSTLVIPSGGRDHLHIVCSDRMSFPGRAPGCCLVVNLSSTVPRCDRTLVLNVGDHPFINHESFVFYSKAFVEEATALEDRVAIGIYRPHTTADRALIKRIVASMNASDFTSGDMLKASNQVWNQTVW